MSADLPPPSHITRKREAISGPQVPSEAEQDALIAKGSMVVPALVDVKIVGAQGDARQIFISVSNDARNWRFAQKEQGVQVLSYELPTGGYLVLERNPANPAVNGQYLSPQEFADHNLLCRNFEALRNEILEYQDHRWALEQIDAVSASNWTPNSRSIDAEDGSIMLERSFVRVTEEGQITISRLDRIAEDDFSGEFSDETLVSAEIEVCRDGRESCQSGEAAERSFSKVSREYSQHEYIMEMIEGAVTHSPDCCWEMQSTFEGTVRLVTSTIRVTDTGENPAMVELTHHTGPDKGEYGDSSYEATVKDLNTGEILTLFSVEAGKWFEQKFHEHQRYLQTPEGILMPHVKSAMLEGQWDKLVPQATAEGVVIEAFLLRTSIGPIICSEFLGANGETRNAVTLIPDPHQAWIHLPPEAEALLRKEVECEGAAFAFQRMESTLRAQEPPRGGS